MHHSRKKKQKREKDHLPERNYESQASASENWRRKKQEARHSPVESLLRQMGSACCIILFNVDSGVINSSPPPRERLSRNFPSFSNWDMAL